MALLNTHVRFYHSLVTENLENKLVAHLNIDLFLYGILNIWDILTVICVVQHGLGEPAAIKHL